MKKLIYLLFAVVLLAGCENDARLYQGEPGGVSGIYFDLKSGNQYVDSLEYSFQNDPLTVQVKEVPVIVKVFGTITDYPRTFRVKVAGGNAVEDEDYVALEEEYAIPAGTALIRLPLKLIRSKELLKKKKDIVLQLEENQYFELLMPEVKDVTSGKVLDATRYKVVYSELITMPIWWTITYAGTYFGNWSVNKFRMINDIMGWQTSDWSKNNGDPVAPGKYGYAAVMLQKELQQKADNKNPAYEDDGLTYMQLGPSYTVDYSALDPQ